MSEPRNPQDNPQIDDLFGPDDPLRRAIHLAYQSMPSALGSPDPAAAVDELWVRLGWATQRPRRCWSLAHGVVAASLLIVGSLVVLSAGSRWLGHGRPESGEVRGDGSGAVLGPDRMTHQERLFVHFGKGGYPTVIVAAPWGQPFINHSPAVARQRLAASPDWQPLEQSVTVGRKGLIVIVLTTDEPVEDWLSEHLPEEPLAPEDIPSFLGQIRSLVEAHAGRKVLGLAYTSFPRS